MGDRTTVSYEIVRYTPELKPGVLELQAHLWGSDPAVNAAYLEWKYDRNPYIGAPLIRLVLCGGQVVGMWGRYGAKWEIGQPPEAFIGPCVGDLVIAPGHRNRGLLAKIIEVGQDDLADSGFPYAFALSAAAAPRLFLLMAVWRSAGPVETAVRRSWGRKARDRLRRAIRPPADERPPFCALDRNGVPGHRGADSHVSLEQAPRPAEMAELVERIRSDGRLRQVRDAEYFTWRFQNPLSLYRFLFWADSRLEGYLVLQAPAHRAHRPVSIVDWEATDARARADLLRAAIRWGEFGQLTVWSATLPTETKAILREAGFSVVAIPESVGRAYRERASRPTILVRAARRDLPAADWAVAGRHLLDPTNWDLRAIYSDGY